MKLNCTGNSTISCRLLFRTDRLKALRPEFFVHRLCNQTYIVLPMLASLQIVFVSINSDHLVINHSPCSVVPLGSVFYAFQLMLF